MQRFLSVQHADSWNTPKEVSGACGKGVSECGAQTTAKANRRRGASKDAGGGLFVSFYLSHTQFYKCKGSEVYP